MQHEVGRTRNNIPVFVNLTRSNAAKEIAQYPNLLSLAKEALKWSHARGPNPVIECDMGRHIGYSQIISGVTDDSIVFYAKVLHDDHYTRFVKKGSPVATQQLTMSLKNNGKTGSYVLHDIWIGGRHPGRPGSPNETDDSRTFWASHAVILQNQQLKYGTTTKVCPY